MSYSIQGWIVNFVMLVVPQEIKRIGEPFSVEVPKQDRLDWYGNKVVLEIDYKYEKET